MTVPASHPSDTPTCSNASAELDDARTAGRGGTGLGLAIARDLVERHGGTITLDPDCEAGARFVVTLPSAS